MLLFPLAGGTAFHRPDRHCHGSSFCHQCLIYSRRYRKYPGAGGGMAVQALSGVAAPIVGGVLYGIVGMQPLIIISCTSFFLSAVMEIFIKIPFVKRAYHGSFPQSQKT